MERQPTKPLKWTVPFDEADGEGIVFFGNYFRLAHRALEHYLPELGIPWAEWFANEAWGVPLRHAEADYLRPLKPGDEFSVDVRVLEVGESSVHFAYEFLAKDGQAAARLKTSHVFVQRKNFQKHYVPPSLRERLERGFRG
jgi:YbgC/YbaW family acyl-CoA thioester hydrolase